jgi:hypothetical protein
MVLELRASSAWYFMKNNFNLKGPYTYHTNSQKNIDSIPHMWGRIHRNRKSPSSTSPIVLISFLKFEIMKFFHITKKIWTHQHKTQMKLSPAVKPNEMKTHWGLKEKECTHKSLHTGRKIKIKFFFLETQPIASAVEYVFIYYFN